MKSNNQKIAINKVLNMKKVNIGGNLYNKMDFYIEQI
jgi:hypothetical protein